MPTHRALTAPTKNLTQTLTKTLVATLAATTVLAAAGCGAGDADAEPSGAAGAGSEPAMQPTSRAATPEDDSAAAGPPFPKATATQTAEGSGEWDLVLTDVRVGDHEGYDRVVLEFAGTGVPGWAVGYVDAAVLDGSGEPVALDGDAVLDVYASGTTWPAADDTYYDGPQRLEPADGGPVAAVHVGGTFEGYTQVLVGVDGDPAPFRAFALTGPARLVVDVVDADPR